MNLSKLFGTQKKSDTPISSDNQKDANITYQQWGYLRAGAHTGTSAGLEISLQAVYNQKLKELLADEKTQEEHRRQVSQSITGLQNQKAGIETKIGAVQHELELEGNKIGEYKHEIADIKENPDKIVANPASKVQFLIGALILLFVSIYLFVFYSSASYSAFFKTFTLDDNGLASAIFDPRAIPLAYTSGLTEMILILTIPFVFLGFGYLIYQISEEKAHKIAKGLKVFALFLLTFVFDCILAYTIDSKIYELNQTLDSAPYSFGIAFTHVNFWLIIFSGFIVYVIWGLVFGFTMNAWIRLDKVGTAIRNIEEKINHSKQQCNDMKTKIASLNDARQQKEAEIQQKEIELRARRYDSNAIILEISNFYNGWASWMSGAGRSAVEIAFQKNVVDKFVEQVNHHQLQYE